ncbi:MAG: thioredoxin domain-containing protein [Patescibacteria group bacterium]
MNKYKDIFFGISLLAVIVVGIITLSMLGGKNSGLSASLSDAVLPSDWTVGNPEATVSLVEYSDFQCPACGAYYPLIQTITEEFKDQVKFTYRNFPLRQIHINADLAARSAEAAGLQGKFWEMHDLLFENQSDWSTSSEVGSLIDGYAKEIGLDLAQFKSDVESKEVADKVEKDYQSGVASKVSGTPTFFLNGKKIENPQSYDQFKAVILKELEPKL